MIPINVRHIILRRSWLYDLDVTLYCESNTCVFEFKGKKIKLVPRAPKDELEVKEQVYKSKTKVLHIEQEIKDEAMVFVVAPNELFLTLLLSTL